MVDKIRELREQGLGYKAIARELQLSKDRVVYLCKKHGMSGTKGPIGKPVPLCVCKQCGKEFKPISNDRVTFCSRDCAYTYQHDHKKLNYCVDCGKEISRRSTRCVACRSEHSRKPKKPKQNKRIHIECAECGKLFVGYKSRRFCCKQCANRYSNRKRETDRRHQLAVNGPVDYTITLTKLVQRDEGLCGICGKPVNMKAYHNAGDYGSIDHIKPVSKGGQHQWDNVQLAHRKCNTDKRDVL